MEGRRRQEGRSQSRIVGHYSGSAPLSTYSLGSPHFIDIWACVVSGAGLIAVAWRVGFCISFEQQWQNLNFLAQTHLNSHLEPVLAGVLDRVCVVGARG